MNVFVSTVTKKIIALHFNEGYRGRLKNGLGLCSTLKEVLAKSGGALKVVNHTKVSPRRHGTDRVLLKWARPKRGVLSTFIDGRRGIQYLFDTNNYVVQIAVRLLP